MSKTKTNMIDKINDEFIVNCTNNTTEERQVVYKFLVENRNYNKCYLTEDSSVIVCRIKGGNSNYFSLIKAKKNNNFPVYTFEQFKEMYLDENTMQENNKKIVGYKLIKPEYMEAIEKIANKNIIGENNGVRTYFNNNILSYRAQISINNLKEAGVLDIWFEPIYEEEVKTINMGSFNLTVKDKKVFHKSEDITSFVTDMQYIFTPILNNKFGKNNNYQCLVEDVVFKKTGCEFNTTKLSDWLKVYDMIK